MGHSTGRIPRRSSPAAPATTQVTTASTETIDVVTAAGLRTVVVHVPALAAGTHPSLVVALHGSSSSGEALEATSGLDAAADQYGFIVAYPDGLLINGERSWNSGGCCEPATSAQVDDIGFLGSVLDALLAAHPIDPTRVFVIGHSNGAILAQEAACRMADRLAAVASVSGALDAGLACNPTQPVSLLEIHGTADENVPYEYGLDAVGAWREMDGCSTATGNDAIGIFRTITWTDCFDDAAVELATVEGGSHSWPSGAADFAWAFLDAHSLFSPA